MCGICGYWHASGLENGADAHLHSMMQTLTHRGPDGEGHHIDPERGIAIGHRRLAINDLTQLGTQPLADRNRRLYLAVNGEFYDFRRHRERLIEAGEHLRSCSDSEIAIGLYRRFGLSFVEHLRGEFAFVLFDYDRDELLLVRDRFGVRPLFYHATPHRIVWGSEVKAVFGHPGVRRRLSTRAALNQMMQIMVPGTSAFEDVHALKPGHMLLVRRVGDKLEYEPHCYWDLDFPKSSEHDQTGDPESYIDSIRDHLTDAISVRLDADVPVGCYLSGGLDSASILGLATALVERPIKAFTVGFEDPEYDESSVAWILTRKLRVEHEVVRLGTSDLYGDMFWSAVWHAERTFHNTLGVAKQHLSRRVHERGFKAVITGEGADELFGGYGDFKDDLPLHALDDPAAAGQRPRGNSDSEMAELSQQHPSWDALCGFTPSWLKPWLAVLDDVRPLLSPSARDELAEYDPAAAIADAIEPTQLQDRHALDRGQYTWIKTMLEGQILSWGGDRMDMANSVESRPAFLDHRVAEAAVRVPPRFRINASVEKWVLRQAVDRVLPAAFRDRPKFAFEAPPSYTSSGQSPQVARLCEQILTDDRIERLGLFSTPRLRGFLREFNATTAGPDLTRRDKILHHLLTIHILHDALVEGCRSTRIA